MSPVKVSGASSSPVQLLSPFRASSYSPSRTSVCSAWLIAVNFSYGSKFGWAITTGTLPSLSSLK